MLPALPSYLKGQHERLYLLLADLVGKGLDYRLGALAVDPLPLILPHHDAVRPCLIIKEVGYVDIQGVCDVFKGGDGRGDLAEFDLRKEARGEPCPLPQFPQGQLRFFAEFFQFVADGYHL